MGSTSAEWIESEESIEAMEEEPSWLLLASAAFLSSTTDCLRIWRPSLRLFAANLYLPVSINRAPMSFKNNALFMLRVLKEASSSSWFGDYEEEGRSISSSAHDLSFRRAEYFVRCE